MAELVIECIYWLAVKQGLEVEVTAQMKRHLAQQVAKQLLGARPLRRLIEDQIVAPIVDKLLTGEYQPGMKVTLDQKPAQKIDKPPLPGLGLPPLNLGQPGFGEFGPPAQQASISGATP